MSESEHKEVLSFHPEADFTREARAKGWRVRRATRKQDMHWHVDFWIALPAAPDEWLGVEVKGPKALHRGAPAQDKLIWVERARGRGVGARTR